MAQKCRHARDHEDCVRCMSMARELLSRADLAEDERARIGKLLGRMKNKESLDDEDRIFLDDLIVRYLE